MGESWGGGVGGVGEFGRGAGRRRRQEEGNSSPVHGNQFSSHALVTYLVSAQPYSPIALLSYQQSQQSVMVEDALVRLGMAAMELSETSCGMEEEERRQFEVWSHFASQLVFFYFLQLINIPSVLTKLRKKVGMGRVGGWKKWGGG